MTLVGIVPYCYIVVCALLCYSESDASSQPENRSNHRNYRDEKLHPVLRFPEIMMNPSAPEHAHILDLPEDVLLYILPYCDLKECLSFSMVSGVLSPLFRESCVKVIVC